MKAILLLSLLWVVGLSGQAQVGRLVWEDDFDQRELDTAKWSFETGTGLNGNWGTGQLDRATDSRKNVKIKKRVKGAENACLAIITRREYYNESYTSGRVNTKGKFSVGPGHRIVARVFPKGVNHPGQGFAFWMMPAETPEGYNSLMWPQGGEIDIMEYVGAIPYHNLGGAHYGLRWEDNQWADANHGHRGFYYSYQHGGVPDPTEPGYGNYPPALGDPNAGSSSFHTYGIDWFHDRIEFFIDDHVYHKLYFDDGRAFDADGKDESAVAFIDGRRVGISEYGHHFPEWHPFEHEMYIILSAGVGGGDQTYGGAIVPEAVFPCSVFIDWVRVYELGDEAPEGK